MDLRRLGKLLAVGATLALGGCLSFTSQDRLYDGASDRTLQFADAGPELRPNGPCYSVQTYGLCLFALPSVEDQAGTPTGGWRVVELSQLDQGTTAYGYALLRASDIERIRTADDLFEAMVVPTTAHTTSNYILAMAETGQVELIEGQVRFRDVGTLEQALSETIADFELIERVQDHALRCALVGRASFEARRLTKDCPDS